MSPKATYVLVTGQDRVLVNEQDQVLVDEQDQVLVNESKKEGEGTRVTTTWWFWASPKGIAEDRCQQGPAKGRLKGQTCDRGVHVASCAMARASDWGNEIQSEDGTPVFQTALGSDGT